VNARVNEQAGTVEVGDESYPFEIDCRLGTVAIDLAGVRFTLRPLSWREKRTLARYAHLGESFLRDQHIQLTVSREARLPNDERQRDALSALARWVNRTGERPGLPLDAQLLATVTLQVSRALQAAPASFDGLDASEVELLWRAARRDGVEAEEEMSSEEEWPVTASRGNTSIEAARAPQPAAARMRAPGMSQADRRIVIVPDADGSTVSEAGSSTGTPESGRSAADAPHTASPAKAGTNAEPHGARHRVSHHAPNAASHAAAQDAPTTHAHVEVPAAPPIQASSDSSRESATARLNQPLASNRPTPSQRRAERFRVILTPALRRGDPTEASKESNTEPLLTTQSERVTAETALAPARDHLRSEPSAQTQAAAAHEPPARARRTITAAHRSSLSAVDAGFDLPLQHPSDERAVPALADALFDELATRLEQAASELGIDMET
jgi:hypothetical protein